MEWRRKKRNGSHGPTVLFKVVVVIGLEDGTQGNEKTQCPVGGVSVIAKANLFTCLLPLF